jgi:acetolactate synthase-1/2/3 large subunit
MLGEMIMDYDVLDEIFKKIQEITGLKDVAYHEIREGRLNPIHKTSTDVLGVEKWKQGHYSNPVYVKDTMVLQYIIDKKDYVYISNTKTDNRSSDAFFFFGVDSILIVPIIDEEKVKGIICIVSIGKLYDITDKQVDRCIDLIKSYKGRL